MPEAQMPIARAALSKSMWQASPISPSELDSSPTAASTSMNPVDRPRNTTRRRDSGRDHACCSTPRSSCHVGGGRGEEDRCGCR